MLLSVAFIGFLLKSVFWGYSSKIATNNRNVFISHSSGDQKSRSRCLQGHAPSKSSTGEFFLVFSSFQWFQTFLGLWLHHSSLSLCLPTASSVFVHFHKNIHHWILWPTQLIHTDLIFRPLTYYTCKNCFS